MMKTFEAEIVAPVLPIGHSSTDHAAVIRLQEWLVIRGYRIWVDPMNAPAIDGDYGAGTQAGVEAFAKANAIAPVVDDRFWLRLTGPMLAAASFRPTARELGPAVVQVALAHLLQEPREARAIIDGRLVDGRQIGGRLVGEDNSGSWVKAYMDGYAGPDWPWCMGGVRAWLKQAAAALGVPLPFPIEGPGIRKFYVPDIVAQARKAGRFVSGGHLAKPVPPGSMFFVPGVIDGQASHVHVGIVTEFNGSAFKTAECNTNGGGSANGWLALSRERQTAGFDFGVI